MPLVLQCNVGFSCHASSSCDSEDLVETWLPAFESLVFAVKIQAKSGPVNT